MKYQQQVVRCKRCNRVIKNSIYKSIGYGKSCLTKMNYLKQKQLIQIKKEL